MEASHQKLRKAWYGKNNKKRWNEKRIKLEKTKHEEVTNETEKLFDNNLNNI